ncbi:TldD/PmbA family protein [Pontibacter silvestris]|uniref:TldD/PmbA family protein n=1 Tax=Pontibacter silvestris TaxID=2305183 RepID=A0ABW4WZM4_9BACT|nr:TldD/PmbA family protein [Pontibacter silvestris]MCC9138688.1 TldD/PmbA family protein [Pontibacter silvestris]
MAVLSKEASQVILNKALQLSKADECEVTLSGSIEGNIRSAGNSVSTAGEKDKTTLSVSATFGKKTGFTTTNEFNDTALERVMSRAEELAKLSPENPEYMPLLGPQTYQEAITFNPTTAAVSSADRAEAVAKSISITKAANLEAAGFLNNTTSFVAIQNSKGLFAYYKETDVSFSVTVRNQEGTGSGHISQSFHDFSRLDTAAQTKIAAHKAVSSAGAQAIEPGKYTVILEPLAASGLLRFLMNGFDARNADEGRSFMSKKGGSTRLGEQLFHEKVTIYSDPLHPELPSPTWNNEGLPLDKNIWVKNGVVQSLSYSRYWADKKGVKPKPAATAIIMEGGEGSVEDLIKETEKGVLVTRFWYTRMVDPQTLTLTGLTRDGTFYIENGRIKFPIKNFRFNESPIIMLNNLEMLGKPVRSGNMIIPPMKIRDFTFTSLSDAV